MYSVETTLDGQAFEGLIDLWMYCRRFVGSRYTMFALIHEVLVTSKGI
jgi:hypothetical protein